VAMSPPPPRAGRARRLRRIALIGLGAAALAIGACCLLDRAIPRMTGPKPAAVVTNGEEARLALVNFLKRQAGYDIKAALERDALDPIPLDATPLKGWWAFGVKHALRPLLGGELYTRVYVVRPGTAIRVGHGEEASETLFRSLLFDKARVPRSEQEAFELARCYAWLRCRQPPSGLVVLGEGEVPAALKDGPFADSIRKEVHGVKIVVRPGPLYSVAFCTYSPDEWGDVYSWRVLVKEQFFRVEQFPIYQAPRVYE